MVVVIRICLIPLFVKQTKPTRAMQAIQPKMKAIQEHYENDKQRQSEEMMKLYKEAGTDPLLELPCDPGADAVLHGSLPGAEPCRARTANR